MKVLMITGDRSFGPGNPRFELQRSALEQLEVVYWGRGSLWPKIPKSHFDVVTVQDPFWRGLFAWQVARRTGAKLNVQIHTDLSAQNFLRHIVAQIVLRHADSVRVVSQKIRNQINHPRVSILPVYVDTSIYGSVVRKPHEGKIILWMGRFEPEKDPLLALEILKKIPDVRLIMLGRGSLEARLRAVAARFHLAAWVEFPGWQDPAPYLAKADIVLSTSKHESFGASIVEALAASVPVIAPDVGIAREAGATVAERSQLADAVIGALQSSPPATLKISLLSKEEWAKRWRESLS